MLVCQHCPRDRFTSTSWLWIPIPGGGLPGYRVMSPPVRTTLPYGNRTDLELPVECIVISQDFSRSFSHAPAGFLLVLRRKSPPERCSPKGFLKELITKHLDLDLYLYLGRGISTLGWFYASSRVSLPATGSSVMLVAFNFI